MDKMKRKKWNARELFLMIYEKLEKEGLVPENILDYSCAGSASELIQSEEFDIVPHIVHGASEGIYMDIRLEAGECARVFSTPKPELRLGTFKTLQTDKEAYMKMSMLGAEFVYALYEYIDMHRDEFNWTGFDIMAFRNAGDIIGKMWTSISICTGMSSTGRVSISRPSEMQETSSGRCGHPVTNGQWNMPVSSQAGPARQHMS